MGRLMVVVLGLGVLMAPTGVPAAEVDEVVLGRDDDAAELVAAEDDDDGFATGATGGDSGDTGDADSTGDSNDGTGSGYSAVSRDRDRSRGDRTRDFTKDGAGGSKRDWSGGHTNDRSRNDTR